MMRYYLRSSIDPGKDISFRREGKQGGYGFFLLRGNYDA